jgi:hypothetical protein
MATEGGRRVMREIIGRTGLFESIFRQPSPLVRPEERLVFNGAWRDFGQWLHDEVAKCHPAAYDLMNNEARLAKQMEGEPEKKEAEADE